MKEQLHHLGHIEPHRGLLRQPHENQLLFKVMSFGNFFRSLDGAYLHFNRVDSYDDFPDDGAQLVADHPANLAATFEKHPDFAASDYYNQSRARTYACCFSLENSEHMWTKYGGSNLTQKVCVQIEFGKLRAMLNETLDPEFAKLQYSGANFDQIFSINYGMVEYVDRSVYRLNQKHLANPIQYTYAKDLRDSGDNELRISLSALGIGQYSLQGKGTLNFPTTLQLAFDMKVALSSGVVTKLLLGTGADYEQFGTELQTRGIQAHGE